MEKKILIAICDRLQQEIPELRWIDVQMAQLNTEERPPVAFPCCLVDLAYTDCQALSAGRQKVSVQVTLQVGFLPSGQTNAHAPEEVREKALYMFDVLAKIHTALQVWNNNRMFMPMQRKQVIPERRPDGLKVYQMVYRMEYMD